MTINARAEKEGYILFETYLDDQNSFHAAVRPIGPNATFNDDRYHTIAVGTPEKPPTLTKANKKHPYPRLNGAVVVLGYPKDNGGEADGKQVYKFEPTLTRNGIIFTYQI